MWNHGNVLCDGKSRDGVDLEKLDPGFVKIDQMRCWGDAAGQGYSSSHAHLPGIMGNGHMLVDDAVEPCILKTMCTLSQLPTDGALQHLATTCGPFEKAHVQLTMIIIN